MIDIYADESCKGGPHRFLILGGIAVEKIHLANALDKFREVRTKFNTWGEVKWTKTSKTKFPFYKEFVDVFFELNAKDDLHFHCLVVDATTFHRAHDLEIGFNKLIYQLLLHKFGRKYGNKYRLYVYLDERTTKQPPDTIRPMLNRALSRYHGVSTDPFKRITFMNSGLSDILQANDLLIGAIGSRKNGYNKLPNAALHKVALGEHIAQRASKCEQWPFGITSRFAKRFTLWNFAYKKRS